MKRKYVFANAPSAPTGNHGAASKKALECHDFSSVKRSYTMPAAHPEFIPPQVFKPRDSSS